MGVSDADMAAAVARQLSAKGYEPAATGAAPDFVMTYRVAVFTSENPRDAYAQIRDPTSLIGPDVAPDPAGSEGLVRETTMVLMALSGADEKVIWQATASGVATGPQELPSGAIRAAKGRPLPPARWIAGEPRPIDPIGLSRDGSL